MIVFCCASLILFYGQYVSEIYESRIDSDPYKKNEFNITACERLSSNREIRETREPDCLKVKSEFVTKLWKVLRKVARSSVGINQVIVTGLSFFHSFFSLTSEGNY